LSGIVTLKAMHPALKPLSGMDELDQALAASDERPLLLFKHSFTCGISAEALDELVTHLNTVASHERRDEPALTGRFASADRTMDAAYAMVTVQTHREVSNAVARRLGVRHETPQALLIRERRVVWSASHFRVTAQAVGAALSLATPIKAVSR
jgi:hypothetical protein